MRKPIAITMATILMLALALTGIGCPVQEEVVPVRELTVGGKGFTEHFIITQMLAQLLEYHGFEVDVVEGLGTLPLRKAVEAGEVDVFAEYTGTVWMVNLGRTFEPGWDNNDLLRMVREVDAGYGIVWLDAIWMNNTYALAVWPDFAEEHGLVTLSDLARLYREMDGKVRSFITLEFAVRPDGLPAWQEHYDFVIYEGYLDTGVAGLSLAALAAHKTDVGIVFATDPVIFKHDWTVMEDDLLFFPPYDLTPQVRAEVLEEFPEIRGILNSLVATFPGGGMPATAEIIAEGQKIWQAINARVDIDGYMPHEAAREYLIEHGLISP